MIALDKAFLIPGVGASVGTIQTILTRQYDYVIVPTWMGWGNLSSLGNIIIGGVVFGIPLLTNRLNYSLKSFLQVYGLTTLIGGIMNGLLSPVNPPSSSRMVSTLPGGRNGFITSNYYPDFHGTFVRRPATRAKGFGSDVTRNPMAAIPTKISENKILF